MKAKRFEPSTYILYMFLIIRNNANIDKKITSTKILYPLKKCSTLKINHGMKSPIRRHFQVLSESKKIWL